MLPRRSYLLTLIVLVTAGGCDEESSVDPPEPGPCADTSAVLALPTPLWESGALLTPPPNDRAADLLYDLRDDWFDQLPQLSGWPMRPTIILPLSAAATAIDPTGFTLYGGSPVAEQATTFAASLADDGLTAILIPEQPLPNGLDAAILAVSTTAITDAEALPACGDNGEPHPDYATAMAALPSPSFELALPFRLAGTHEALVLLWQAIADAPVLAVESSAAVPLADYNSWAPEPAVEALLRPNAADGALALPDYRDAEGIFVLDAAGQPAPQGTTYPGFIVALPAGGAPPYPWVIFQHGGGQDKRDVFALAGPLVEAGFALLAMDLPHHGNREPPGGGTDLDMVDFDNLLVTRDNFRQGAADHLAVVSGVETLNASLETTLGVPNALDPDRAFFLGLSMGAITGSLTFAVGDDLRAAALFVAGGGYPELVSQGLFFLFVADIFNLPSEEAATALGFLEALLDGADPLAYAQRTEDQAVAPRPALFLQAVNDPIIYMPASDAWGRAFGADLAVPFDHPVAGMTELTLPAADNFAWTPGGETATRLLVQCPMNDVPRNDRHPALIIQDYAQEMVAHCFSTFDASGSCEVIDTDFASH